MKHTKIVEVDSYGVTLKQDAASLTQGSGGGFLEGGYGSATTYFPRE